MKDNLEKLRQYYSKLTPAERIRMFVAAFHRRDYDDLDLLDRTCPVTDLLTYAARITGLQFAATHVVLQILAHQLYIWAALTPGASGPHHPTPHNTVVQLLQRQIALWRGFSAWCHANGYDPRQVLALAPLGDDFADPVRTLIDMQMETFDTWDQDLPHDPIDPKHVQLWRDAFARRFELSLDQMP